MCSRLSRGFRRGSAQAGQAAGSGRKAGEKNLKNVASWHPKGDPGGDPREQSLPLLGKTEFRVPRELTVSQFLDIIRQEPHAPEGPGSLLLAGEPKSLVSMSVAMAEVYRDHKDEDGFVSVTYATQETAAPMGGRGPGDRARDLESASGRTHPLGRRKGPCDFSHMSRAGSGRSKPRALGSARDSEAAALLLYFLCPPCSGDL
ncbi:Microtubule-associated proteins 1A/1B light chain 3C [Fukomys damarensis]|uniref:Microtubule-associated proteins 1A/1B light chain 3C n=1 Tax=Fukomys damarensis TaxID=885580 RepID=A0A091DRJ9_FUKDA|nr:Microtubule-associated proteins 1A/1B light chain 3C [Fukomys damarensis]